MASDDPPAGNDGPSGYDEAAWLRGDDVGRIQAFSDAVFAIAITLLVLDLDIPASTDPDRLTSALGDLWPQYLAFALSFAVIGMYWISHHATFRFVQRYDGTLLWLNLLLLATIVAIPFPTRVLADFGDTRSAVVLYAGVLCAAGTASAVLWWYAARRDLLRPDLDDTAIRVRLRRALSAPVVFAVSIPVALATPNAVYLWLLLFVADPVNDRLAALANRSGAGSAGR